MADSTKWVNIGQFLIYIAVLLLSAGIAYASLQNRISTAEERLNELKSDHDVIIKISQNVDEMQRMIHELKIDVKELKGDVSKHILRDR